MAFCDVMRPDMDESLIHFLAAIDEVITGTDRILGS